MKLKDAIGEAELSIFRDKKEQEAHRVIIQAAKDFQTIIEAREKATQGEWELWNSCSWNRFGIKYGGKPFIYPYNSPSDGHQDLAIKECDTKFILTAANITSKYIGGENE